ncbi:anthranilate phosphoribosyltransferase [Xylanibacillus composti]|uniref:Anthranilate phosphoribosyltransferase n=1 Tax=Xylanibacillus composti TaxID=1572762 RepID=A0A8J4GYI7_9BACL|nr:anthranilate phosphoribosyltransferase [Xylanibacillus composti]MDT9725469.1 anthranilate phosphoribosyltransferase [Xylanibacillus composti]GIQ67562.1 anthranilate phosphoribosyltransferase [Xylanibacillus composti]
MGDMMKEALAKLIQGHSLSREDSRSVMSCIMEGEATPAQIASLVTILRMKGESIDEIAGFAEIMRGKASRVETERRSLLDTCGTGGDGMNTFNISTAAAIIAAAGGVRVAKHGNRAASSKSGSADVLEALGVQITLNHEQAARCLDEVGLCFMFAQVFHQSMKHAAAPRKEIGFRTIFNMLGPLTNPAGADRQLMGVFERRRTEVLALVLRELGLYRALVVCSHDGLDEISISAPTQITELRNDAIQTFDVTPEELGLKQYEMRDVVGGDARENAEIIRQVFAGKKGAARDIVLANAGACFYLDEQADSLRDGVELAGRIVDSGIAMEKLEHLVRVTKELAHVS